MYMKSMKREKKNISTKEKRIINILRKISLREKETECMTNNINRQ